MTVNSLVSQQMFTSTGGSGETFSINQYGYDEKTDIVVYTDEGDGTVTVHTLNTDYDITDGTPTGGTITWVGEVPGGAGTKVYAIRWVPLLQGTALLRGGKLPSPTLEQMVDRTVEMVQQVAERTGGTEFSLTAIAYMGRLASAPTSAWDGETLRIADVADPTSAQDAATKAYVDIQIVSAGNMPVPADPGDDDKGLRASAGGATWQYALVPAVVAADEDYVLQGRPSGTGSGDYDWVHRESARNLLDNGGFRIDQRNAGVQFTAASTPYDNADDSYNLDRWYLLVEAADVTDVQRVATPVPDGAQNALEFIVQSVGAGNKFGFVQILESADSIPWVGKPLSLSFDVRTSTGAIIENVRAAILEWSGTADAPTSGLVSTWQPEGTNPTLGLNWDYANTPANIAVDVDAFGRKKIENAVIASGTKNIAVFIWIDDDDTIAADTIYFGNVKLEPGVQATAYVEKTYADDFERCERHFAKSYAVGTKPASATRVGEFRTRLADGYTGATDLMSIQLHRRMRVVPTIRLFNPNDGAEDQLYNYTATNARAASAEQISERSFEWRLDSGSVTDQDRVGQHWVAEADL